MGVRCLGEGFVMARSASERASRRAELISRGMCIECGRREHAGGRLCEPCTASRAVRVKTRYELQRASGTCTQCSATATAGACCSACRAKRSANERARYVDAIGPQRRLERKRRSIDRMTQGDLLLWLDPETRPGGRAAKGRQRARHRRVMWRRAKARVNARLIAKSSAGEYPGRLLPGWVYVLTSYDHPGVCKVGATRDSPHGRARGWSNDTLGSVWNVAYSVRTETPFWLESEVHYRLGEFRLPGRRKEFFRLPLADVKSIIVRNRQAVEELSFKLWSIGTAKCA